MKEIMNISDWLINQNRLFDIEGVELDRIVRVKRIKDGEYFSRGSTVGYRDSSTSLSITSISAFQFDKIHAILSNGSQIKINELSKVDESLNNRKAWREEQVLYAKFDPNFFLHDDAD